MKNKTLNMDIFTKGVQVKSAENIQLCFRVSLLFIQYQ